MTLTVPATLAEKLKDSGSRLVHLLEITKPATSPLFLTDAGVHLDLAAGFFRPWILAADTISTQATPGRFTISDLVFHVDNLDGDALTVRPLGDWIGSTVAFYVWDLDTPEADRVLIFQGQVIVRPLPGIRLRVQVRPKLALAADGLVDAGTYDLADFPDMTEGANGTSRAVLYGIPQGVLLPSLDENLDRTAAGPWRFAVAGHAVRAVSNVKAIGLDKAGRVATLGTLSLSSFVLTRTPTLSWIHYTTKPELFRESGALPTYEARPTAVATMKAEQLEADRYIQLDPTAPALGVPNLKTQIDLRTFPDITAEDVFGTPIKKVELVVRFSQFGAVQLTDDTFTAKSDTAAPVHTLPQAEFHDSNPRRFERRPTAVSALKTAGNVTTLSSGGSLQGTLNTRDWPAGGFPTDVDLERSIIKDAFFYLRHRVARNDNTNLVLPSSVQSVTDGAGGPAWMTAKAVDKAQGFLADEVIKQKELYPRTFSIVTVGGGANWEFLLGNDNGDGFQVVRAFGGDSTIDFFHSPEEVDDALKPGSRIISVRQNSDTTTTGTLNRARISFNGQTQTYGLDNFGHSITTRDLTGLAVWTIAALKGAMRVLLDLSASGPGADTIIQWLLATIVAWIPLTDSADIVSFGRLDLKTPNWLDLQATAGARPQLQFLPVLSETVDTRSRVLDAWIDVLYHNARETREVETAFDVTAEQAWEWSDFSTGPSPQDPDVLLAQVGAWDRVSLRVSDFFFRVTYAPRIKEPVVLTADVEGFESVGDGTGPLISGPVRIAEDALKRFGGLTAGDMNAASIGAASIKATTEGYSGIHCGGVTDRPRTVRDTLSELCGNFGLYIFPGFDGKVKMDLWTGYSPPPVAPVMVRLDFMEEPSPSREPLVTKISGVAAYDWGLKEYKTKAVVLAPGSPIVKNETELRGLWIGSSTALATVLGHAIGRNGREPLVLNGAFQRDRLAVELLDLFSMTEPIFGWTSAKLLVVEGWRYNPGSRRVELRLVEGE